MDDPLQCPDPQAERRWSYGRLLAAERDWAGACDLFEQALERAPGFAPAWVDLGEARERLADKAAAAEAYARAAALDSEDRLGSRARLARARGESAPKLSPAYVARLFDDYAKRFDRHLLEDLHYSGPEAIDVALEAVAWRRRFAHALDLGCGTGLAGAALRARAQRLEGVDLSAKMIEQARVRGLYDALCVGEAVAFLQAAASGAYDLIAAADVLVYIGDLSALFGAAARALTPEGLFVFTVETAFGEEDFALAPSMRFRHSEAYVRRNAVAAGFDVRSLEAGSTRVERDMPVPSLVVVLRRKPSPSESGVLAL
jgi:predicted TPR repeat methyltransferase